MDEVIVRAFGGQVKEVVNVPEIGECWEWTGAKTEQGYGYVSISSTVVHVHRLSYLIMNGPSQGRKQVIRHRCDNPACVRPDHLLIGTAADNAMDCVLRKRRNCGRARQLNEDDVLAIREGVADGVPRAEMMIRFAVSRDTVDKIIQGATWQHVGGPIQPPKERKQLKAYRHLSADEIAQIINRVSLGERMTDLAAEYGVANATISNAARGRYCERHLRDTLRDRMDSTPN